MTDLPARAAEGSLAAAPWSIWLGTARSLRGEYAKSGRHRLALVVTLVATGLELVSTFLEGASAASVVSTLRVATWSAALSTSATLVQSRDGSPFARLAQLRGYSPELRRRLEPAARVALAFSVHGPASALLGLCLVARADTLGARSSAVVAALLLLSLSALTALGLSGIASLARYLLGRGASVLYWALLIIPVVLYPALSEVPSLLDLMSRYTEGVLRSVLP